MKMINNEEEFSLEELADHKCPNCHAAVEFDAKSQSLICNHCGSDFNIEAIKKNFELDNEKDEERPWKDYDYTSGTGSWSVEEQNEFSNYLCESCAGEIILNANVSSTVCPYCSSTLFVKSNLNDVYKPDIVLPFQITKKEAIDQLKAHYSKKLLLPNCFKDENHLKEIQGLYVPFWIYAANANAKVSYNAKRIRTWRSGDYRYTKTSHFRLFREVEIGFDNVPNDASKKMDDALMHSIEPFDFSKAVEFNPSYLSGFVAEKYDLSPDEGFGIVSKRIENSLINNVNSTVNTYSTYNLTAKSVSFLDNQVEYALLPVYTLHTKYQDIDYYFTVNGQTGKVVGTLPLDKKKAVKYFVFIALASFAIFAILISIFLSV